MRIQSIPWPPDRIEHIARHNVTPDEVDEAAFDDLHAIVEALGKSESDRKKRIYRLLGRTQEGRYMVFIFIYEGRGTVYPVTARDMTSEERRYYRAKATK